MGKADGLVNARIAQDICDIIRRNHQVQKITVRELVLMGKAISIDLVKNIFIRLNLLVKLNVMYAGLMEDLLSYSALNKYYEDLKLRIQK